MQRRTFLPAARLPLLAALLPLLVTPASALDAEGIPPEVKVLQARIRRMEQEMERMRHQLEELLRAQRKTGPQTAVEQRQESPAAPETEEKTAPTDELEHLRRLAGQKAQPQEEKALPTEKTFIARGLSLQALNPEISPAGDLLLRYRARKHHRSDSDFEFRALDIHVQSYLDPFSKMKAAVEVHSDGAELAEAYFTRFGVLPGLSITAGKFRQQFGVVNRWHKDALDQIDFPLALRGVFGEGGLNQTGVSVDWTAPAFLGASQQAIVQITDGENARVFGENSRHLPSILARYSNYRDLSKDTYLDIGITGLTGWNDEWETARDTRQTWALGGDVSLRWEPTERMRYASLEWRSEFYYLDKGVVAPDGSGRDRIKAWGAYSSLQRQISRTVEIGLRGDYFAPDAKAYAAWGPDALAVARKGPYRWQVGPYVTWWQSPWVKLRLEVDYADGRHTGPSELACTGQAVFAAGPHKHERY